MKKTIIFTIVALLLYNNYEYINEIFFHFYPSPFDNIINYHFKKSKLFSIIVLNINKIIYN